MKDSTGLTAAGWAKKVQLARHPARIRAARGRRRSDRPRVIIPTSILGKLDPKPAAARSIALLQQGSGSFFKEGGCGSCHAQNLTSMAVNAAFANHIPVNAEAKAGGVEGRATGVRGLRAAPAAARRSAGGRYPAVRRLPNGERERGRPIRPRTPWCTTSWRSSMRPATGTRAGWLVRRWATAISRAPRWRFVFCRCTVPPGARPNCSSAYSAPPAGWQPRRRRPPRTSICSFSV